MIEFCFYEPNVWFNWRLWLFTTIAYFELDVHLACSSNMAKLTNPISVFMTTLSAEYGQSQVDNR